MFQFATVLFVNIMYLIHPSSAISGAKPMKKRRVSVCESQTVKKIYHEFGNSKHVARRARIHVAALTTSRMCYYDDVEVPYNPTPTPFSHIEGEKKTKKYRGGENHSYPLNFLYLAQ